MKYIHIIFDNLHSIKLVFSGINPCADKDRAFIKGELYDLEIPTFIEDRENLKSDRDQIINDFKKAFQEKELAIHNE